MSEFIVGLDLGQASDYTALAVLERVGDEDAVYSVRHLERPALGTPYPLIVGRVTRMLNSDQLKENVSLVIDQTGVGAPVIDLFKQAEIPLTGISIHGGDKVAHDGIIWRVPKRDLVSTLQVLLQTGRLKVASRLELGPVLSQEMLNFRVKIDLTTAHDSYAAWRDGDHDDLVLAVALAAWWGEKGPKPAPLISPAILPKKSFFGYQAGCFSKIPRILY